MNNTATALRQPPEPALAREAEVQRRNIRIQLPATVKIDRHSYKVHNISTGGFSIRTEGRFKPPQSPQDALVFFPFDSFSFHLKVQADLVYSNENTAGFRFHHTGQRQTSLLNHIVKSYLDGLLTTGQDFIAIASDGDAVSKRRSAESNSRNKGKLIRLLPVAAFGAVFSLGAWALLGDMFERFYN